SAQCCLHAMRRLALLALIALTALTASGCAHRGPARRVTPPLARPSPIWPVPVRVMTWTAEGVVQIGLLPNAPPATPPLTPWYVEPARRLDTAAFRALIATIRSERIPGLSLRGQPVATWLGELVDLPALNALVLDDTEIADPSLSGLVLRRLYLARTPIDDTT